MSTNATSIKNAVWQACELLAKEKALITTKNIKTKLCNLGYYCYQELNEIDHDIGSLINKWRIEKLNSTCNKKDDFNIYEALAIPKNNEKNTTSAMQKKIFNLEYELNKHKHASCRANKRIKLLEKKLHTLIANVKRERQELAIDIKNMLST